MANHLTGETSPYLQQHAHNPVDWYPWGDSALERARRENRPILLSIGYSACHWCHVMAHESFENPEIAALMNARFVNIKVDREERPDLDRIYQIAHQLMTQRAGGWPLTMALDPKTLAPFFAGTYFPRESRHGLPGFDTVLTRVSDWFTEHHDELAGQDARMRDVFAQLESTPEEDDRLDDTPIATARSQFMRQFDAEYGGMRGAPKFPHPSNLEFLLDDWARSGNERSRDAALFTLQRMAEGGLFDQIGGGFSRYSVDQRWQIPHFEKMLYDNGPLLALYCDALRIEENPLFRHTANATADWVMREMTLPEGGYCASLDADSEGEEGRFYVWDTEQVRDLLASDYDLVARHFGLDEAPNFEGRWHLTVHSDVPALATAFNVPEEDVRQRLAHARQVLFQAREQRVRPGRDDKVLTAWNALMIRGMAVAARTLERDDCLASAQRAADFLHEQLWRDGRLLATYKDGRAHLPAYLDDHAFLLDALLTLLQVDWRSQDLTFAQALADLLLTHFEDTEHGGFFFTADDHERLLYRLKPLPDESLPSGNGIAARALLQLGHLLGETRYLDAAERTLRMSWAMLRTQPMAHASLLDALCVWLTEPEIVILRGDTDTTGNWRRAAAAAYAPQRLVFAIPADAPDLPPGLAVRQPPSSGQAAVAYICRGTQCSAPITSREMLVTTLSGANATDIDPKFHA